MSMFIMLAQGFFFILGGWYFLEMITAGNQDRKAIGEEDKTECERINKSEKITLGTPLTEKARPSSFDEIIGQEKAIKALTTPHCREKCSGCGIKECKLWK